MVNTEKRVLCICLVLFYSEIFYKTEDLKVLIYKADMSMQWR